MQDKFDHCDMFAKIKDSARILTNAYKDHSMPLEGQGTKINFLQSIVHVRKCGPHEVKRTSLTMMEFKIIIHLMINQSPDFDRSPVLSEMSYEATLEQVMANFDGDLYSRLKVTGGAKDFFGFEIHDFGLFLVRKFWLVFLGVVSF